MSSRLPTTGVVLVLLLTSIALGQSKAVPRAAAPRPTKVVAASHQVGSVQQPAFDRSEQPQRTAPERLPETPPDSERANGERLTLADFENMAIAGNPSIARAASLVQAARGNWVQVGLGPNPQTGYEGQQIGSRGRAEQDGVFVEQEFVRGGKLRLNREIAAQEIARACQELAAQQQRVRTDVRVNFYQVLIAQEQERLTKDLAGIAQESLTVSDNLFKRQEVGRVDVLQSRLEVQNASVLAHNARNRSAAAWRSLAAVVGEPELPPQPVMGDLSEVPEHEWQGSLERLLTTSPEIAIAMTNVERARWAAERARVEKTPNVTVRGLVNWRDNGIGGDSDGAISVGIPLPVWNKNQGGVIQAAHQAAAAERALDQLELSMQNRLSPIFERYANAKNQVTQYRDEILPTAKETLDLTRKLYQAGELGYLNLLTAQRTYFQTNLSYLDAVRELRTAAAQIDGLLLSNSLESGPDAAESGALK